MIRINLNFETIGSICAIITSVVALFVAVQQTQVMRQQNDASVWPIITTEITIKQDEQHSYVRFVLANVGVGPAIVRNSNLFIDEHVVSGYQDFKERLLVGALKDSVSAETSNLNGVIGPGDSKMVLQLSWQRNDTNDEAFLQMVDKFVNDGTRLRIYQCYCSVFNRCYEAGLGQREGPQDVDSCATQDVDPMTPILESINPG